MIIIKLIINKDINNNVIINLKNINYKWIYIKWLWNSSNNNINFMINKYIISNKYIVIIEWI